MFLTNLVEWGNIFKLFIIRHSNNWVANLFNPVEFAFYTWLYCGIIENYKLGTRIMCLFFLYLTLTVINISFFQGLLYFDSYSYIFGCCCMVYCVYLYFNQLMLNISDSNILINPIFWISTGVLFFYAGQAFLMAFFEYFLYIRDWAAFRSTFFFINNFLNILLYSCLTIAFFCRPRQPGTS
jgi:hypothetical protein